MEDATSEFKNDPGVQIVLGDSALDLSSILDNLFLPATFWLDAEYYPYDLAALYYSYGVTSQITPLLYELDQIKSNSIKTHTIMINNIFTLCNTFSDFYTITDIENAIYAINANYKIEYVTGGEYQDLPNNVLVAYVP